MNLVDLADVARGRALEPVARATGLHHLVLETPDLAAAERFYVDFGLTVAERTEGALYLRAAGRAHHVLALVRGRRARLLAVALEVDGEQALGRLAALPEASPVEERASPGGGLGVRLAGPEGLEVHAVWGIDELAPLTARGPLELNGAGQKPRVGSSIRLSPRPCSVARLGHAVIDTARPVATLGWLLRTFGLIISDKMTLDDEPEDRPVAAFLRCDLGETPADHHTLAVGLGAQLSLGHAAFEVEDVDEIGVGSAWLAEQGHEHSWGIGRHLVGSAIFDYWRAPDGTTVEHYADGDLFDASAPTGAVPLCSDTLLQWGPRPPRGFGLPALSLSTLVASARSLSASDEASLGLLLRAAKALSR